jgi:hypothetical protein
MFFTTALMMATLPAQAVNLLQNPSFEANSGHAIPTSWTRFAPPTAAIFQPFGNYWVEVSGTLNGNPVIAHSGNDFWKEWGACYDGTNNVAGLYQTFGATPGSTYQASGWFYINSGDQLGADCYVWIQVEFLDSSSNLLALYKSGNFNVNAGLNAWVQFQVTNACDVTQPVSTGDPFFNTYAITGAVNQVVAPAGTASVVYRYCYLQFLSEGGSSYFDDADLEQLTGPLPLTINNLNPQNEIFVAPSNGISFDVSSPSGHINTNAIHLVLNGNDVSSSLAFSGSISNWTVFYNGLQSNTAYNVSITATDSFNFKVSANTTFQTTWLGVQAPSYIWEAEDWDFTNGMFYDNPDLCNAPGGANCYFGVVGVSNVDEYVTAPPPAQFYRGATDGIGTKPSGDYSRPNLFAAGRVDYCINPFIGDPLYDAGSEWVNYTRDWPSSTNWIVGRFANGASLVGTVQMSVINGGVTNIAGTFTMNPYPPANPSFTAYQYVYLEQTNGSGQLATVVLNGKETLQMTSGGNLLPTFYMLVPAIPDLPYMTTIYPDGKHPFELTNALSFTVTTGSGAIFTANSIQLILDGNDVSSNLIITGSNLSNNVVYPTLQPNVTHVAIINVTNSLGHGISLIDQFDTFSQATNASISPYICSNYMFEAEDYDFNGGQYIPSASYVPDSPNLSQGYRSQVSVTNVDFQHTPVSGEPTDGSEYTYRQNGIPTQSDSDYLRQVYVHRLVPDYQLNWFGGGDWANYTRDYPVGTYNIYARTSGLGAFTMNFGQVVAGGGTTNQTVKPIGQFRSTLPNVNTFGWVPLTDAGGVAPVTVNITGVTTFQVLTPTGLCYPNYFMLVQTSPINASATRSGGNINISFPTQTGWNYRVFYRTNLTAGSWTLLNSALGTGSAVAVTDPNPGDKQRFYKVTSP